jgi:hypothetical protein
MRTLVPDVDREGDAREPIDDDLKSPDREGAAAEHNGFNLHVSVSNHRRRCSGWSRAVCPEYVVVCPKQPEVVVEEEEKEDEVAEDDDEGFRVRESR